MTAFSCVCVDLMVLMGGAASLATAGVLAIEPAIDRRSRNDLGATIQPAGQPTGNGWR